MGKFKVGDWVIVKDYKDIGEKWRNMRCEIIEIEPKRKYPYDLRMKNTSTSSIFEEGDFELDKESCIKKLLSKIDTNG